MTEMTAWVGWSPRYRVSQDGHGDKVRAKRRRARRQKNEEEVRKVLKEKAPSLYLGERGVSLEASELAELRRRLSDSAANHDFRDRHNFFANGLARGVRELDWRLEVPSPIKVFHAPQSPISVAGQRLGASFRELLRIADQSLGPADPEIVTPGKRGRRFTAEQIEAGQLIFSAIARGAILSEGWLTAFPKAVERGPWEEMDGVSLELHLSDVRGYRSKLDVSKARAVRRWFPDPVTSILLFRWYRRHGKAWPDCGFKPHYDIELCLAAFLSWLPVPNALRLPGLPSEENGRPRIMRWLQDHACREAAKDYPGFLIDYAKSLECGPSLQREAWLRLQTGLIARSKIDSQPKQGASAGINFGGEKSIPTQASLNPNDIAKDHKQILSDLRSCLTKRQSDRGAERSTSSAINALEHFLRVHQHGPVILILVAQWLLHRLRHTVLGERKLKTSSAKRYLQTTGRSLILATWRNPNFATYDAEDWTDVYERAINLSPSTHERSFRRQRLAEFHDWLYKSYSVPQVNLNSESAIPRNVDANILTPSEYSRARAWLGRISNRRQASVCSLVLTIAFRCGMRRKEVQLLRLRDLEGVMEPGFNKPSVKVMNQPGLTQKSQSSVRRYPAWLLFPDEELHELRRWVIQRKQELGGEVPNAYLFSMEGRPSSAVDDNYCFTLVTRAMRAASGDPAIRFHHNRHSFATLTFLRLLEHEPGELIPEQWVMDDTGKPLLPHWGEDYSRLAELGRADAPTQTHLWELCTWCGHLSPGETMATYSHLIDWTLGMYLRKRRDPELSITQQAQLLGVEAAGIEKFRNRNGLAGRSGASDLERILQRKRKNLFVTTHGLLDDLPQAPIWDVKGENRLTRVSPLLLYEMFSALEQRDKADFSFIEQAEGDAALAISDTFDLPVAAVREWVHRAELLSNLTTKKGTPRLRFWRTQPRQKRTLPESRRDYAPSSEIFIAPPRETKLKEDADKVFQRLTELFALEPKLVLDVLAACVQGFQRTKTQIKLKHVDDKRNFLRVIDAIGLKKNAFVELVIAPELDAKAARKYWSEKLDVAENRIVIKKGKPGQLRPFRKGTANIDFKPDERGQRSAWTVVEFVLVSAVILLPPVEMVGGILGDEWKNTCRPFKQNDRPEGLRDY